MIITFLGTGTSQGVPVIGCKCDICRSSNPHNKRLRTSIHIETQGKSFVIDTGPDFRQQMLRANIERLDAVLFTHSHKDHTAGLDDVRPFNFSQKKSILIYASLSVLQRLKLEYYYAFSKNKYPGVPQLQLNEITDTPFTIAGVTCTPLPVFHLNMPVLGFRIANFSYITDANYIPEATLDKIKGTEILVLNALQQEKHISHFNLDEAVQVANCVNPAQTYFTHISHKMESEEIVNKKLPDNIRLGYDGLTLQIDE